MEKIKVISFNIRYADDAGGNRIEDRAPRLKKILNKYDGDLIGFQEATPKWLKYLEHDYSDTYEIFNKYRCKTNLESVPIMWKKDRFECLDKGYFWLSDTPLIESKGYDELGLNRICMWVVLKDKKNDKVFTYINTHYGFGECGQVKSSELIKKFISNKKYVNVIITGDFNMLSTSKAYESLLEIFKDVNKLTINDSNTTFHDYGKIEIGKHIDFCFITFNSIKANEFCRITDLVNNKFPSDHYGIFAEVSIK